MKLGSKTIAVLMLTSWLLIGFIGYSIRNELIFNHKDPSPRANVYIFFETSRGSWAGGSGNVITNIGERYVRNIIGWDNQTANNATQWISLGNSTIVVTNTKLDTEATATGFTRAGNDTALAWMNGTDYAYNITTKFTASGAIRINATCLHWSPTSNSANNGFSMASVTATTFANNDNITITWVISWDGN